MEPSVVRPRTFGISDRVTNPTPGKHSSGPSRTSFWTTGCKAPHGGLQSRLWMLSVAPGPIEDLDDPTFSTRETAYRLLEKGMTVVDPERLVFDSDVEYPPEVIAAASKFWDDTCASSSSATSSTVSSTCAKSPATVPTSPAWVFAYNHSASYVSRVLPITQSYGEPAAQTVAASTAASVAVDWALAQVWTPYVWAGETPGVGFD